MASVSALQTLTDLSTREVEEAVARLGQANMRVNKALEKLQLLQEYRQSYAQRLQEDMSKGLGISHYNNYLSFLANLDKAVTQQQQEVAMNQHLLEQQRRDWQNAERKRMSFTTLQNRYQQKKMLAENKREQKLNDEFAERLRSKVL